MPTHDAHSPGSPENAPQHGYEVTDANTGGVLIFLVAMGMVICMLFVVCFGIGKVINTAITRADGPPNKWNKIQGQPTGKLEMLPSSAKLGQQQLQEIVGKFPEPRLEIDNGDQDVADMHTREDLLLDHYSWIDQKQGTVRIPISRAMALVAERGLPVEAYQRTEPVMTADKTLTVAVPLTNGFARTGYEQELETVHQQRMRGVEESEQAALRGRQQAARTNEMAAR